MQCANAREKRDGVESKYGAKYAEFRHVEAERISDGPAREVIHSGIEDRGCQDVRQRLRIVGRVLEILRREAPQNFKKAETSRGHVCRHVPVCTAAILRREQPAVSVECIPQDSSRIFQKVLYLDLVYIHRFGYATQIEDDSCV